MNRVRVKGAQWDFKANAGDDMNDGGILERVDPRPPDPPIEIPPRVNVRGMYIRRMDVEKYAPTKACAGCQKVPRRIAPSCIVATHSNACRERMERLVVQDPGGADRVVRTKTRLDSSNNSPSSCRFVFQSSLEFADVGT